MCCFEPALSGNQGNHSPCVNGLGNALERMRPKVVVLEPLTHKIVSAGTDHYAVLTGHPL